MPCYHPLTAYKTSDGGVVFTGNLKRYDIIHTLELACGQCIGCRLERSRQWATRCMHEAQMHQHNTFVTLTYNEENLPPGNSLDHRDFQLFMKKLRKQSLLPNSFGILPGPSDPLLSRKGIRYYMCGEYGDLNTRPHFHAALFNIDFNDKQLLKTTASKTKLYTSETLQKIWNKGYASLGAVTFESAAYIARYVMKKITGDKAKPHYTTIDEHGEITEKKPEYNRMSLRPGLGRQWLEKFHRDVYPDGLVVINGIQTNAPRYYDKLHKKTFQLEHEDLDLAKHQRAIKQFHDNTDARRAAKETVTKARISQLKRGKI